MSFSTNKSNDERMKPAIISLMKCTSCNGTYKQITSYLECTNCGDRKHSDAHGVWHFLERDDALKQPAIFKDPEFQRWLKIFNEQESKKWIIYRNKFYRFFAQAGHRKLGKALKKTLSSKETILEIGAGVGTLLNFFSATNYVAVDTSLESLQALKARWPSATCIWTNASALPFHNQSFSNVVSLHTLEHIYYLAEALEENIRIMEPKANMYFVIPTEGGWGFSLGRKFITGPHLRKAYGLDVNFVMDREHINTAQRVIKFLNMYFDDVQKHYWPFPFLKIMGPNAMIFGQCTATNTLSNEHE